MYQLGLPINARRGARDNPADGGANPNPSPPCLAMKLRDILPNERDIHLIKIKYCEDTSPIQQAEKTREQHKLLMPRHLQQPHKETTPQPRSFYWSICHSTHEPTCNQICNKYHTDETRH
jgi:hypothetical protein